MAKYRVLEKSFIGNSIAEEGQVVEYDGEAANNLELVEDEKPAKKAKADSADSLV
jgi:hypothetical protein